MRLVDLFQSFHYLSKKSKLPDLDHGQQLKPMIYNEFGIKIVSSCSVTPLYMIMTAHSKDATHNSLTDYFADFEQ